MKWYKHDPDAFIVGTLGMTFQEIGAYIRLINLLYARDGILPNDDIMLARRMRCNFNRWCKIKRQLIARGKIWVVDGMIMAKRVEKTIADVRKQSKINGNWQSVEKLKFTPSHFKKNPNEINAKKTQSLDKNIKEKTANPSTGIPLTAEALKPSAYLLAVEAKKRPMPK